MVGEDGEAIEQIKFADISLGHEIHASALAPSISTENFRWFTQPQRKIVHAADSPWDNGELPVGFHVVSTHEEELPGRDAPVTHILYSDGLANVSVFIEPTKEKVSARRSNAGATNSYSIQTGGYLITAVGEVPAATVKMVATSMRPN